MAYTGLVRAKSPCYIGGTRYSPGDAFEVTDYDFWSDDPFVPVRLAGFEPDVLLGPDLRPVRGRAIYEPIAFQSQPANRRPKSSREAALKPVTDMQQRR
jgi:hypothetical protein